jgi:hypothetical protein
MKGRALARHPPLLRGGYVAAPGTDRDRPYKPDAQRQSGNLRIIADNSPDRYSKSQDVKQAWPRYG